MENSGLLSSEHLQTIFSNIPELISVNEYFAGQLKDALKAAEKDCDEVRVHVCILYVGGCLNNRVGKCSCLLSSNILSYPMFCRFIWH